MTDPLPSYAEKRAAEAVQYKVFSGISLIQIRQDLIELLSAIRSNGLFEEYTKHDISHVDSMLGQLDWLIPDDTKEIMTCADWLLIVLSAYFHDLGMLITRNEYDSRNSSSGFPQFRESQLAAGDDVQKDYTAQIMTLSEPDLDLYLYQEYVRQNHAKRIRYWIEGENNPQLGAAIAVTQEVGRLLNGATRVFRDDLAIVCESHHLDDLDNTNKYKVRRHYGSHPQEIANVQYAAVILRTMDLLHITSDRTPSVAFRIISPRDPISQQEWAKQLAVRSVEPQLAFDQEGNQKESLPKNTIEVHATYDNSDGFFGLTDYLSYAEGQMRASSEQVSISSRRFDSKHRFPWRFIDTSNIEAIGFLNRPFKFSLDQRKILDLLTGHTLYNDSSVVLRELIQNSIDAVRLAHGQDAVNSGKILISWDEQLRILEIRDNGTGMTQEIVENNFLHVGSSYYQDPRFKKKNPDFNPISRFGIGVLSAFMVADHVEVITCHQDETEARLLELRSVHGKYLVRVLDKETDPVARQLLPSGTIVRLHIRPSAKQINVLAAIRYWVVIPGCQVKVCVNGGDEISVGFESVKLALENMKNRQGIIDRSNARVVFKQCDGVSLAYGTHWSEYFKEWQFDREYASNISGFCVEGIRVRAGTPGFRKAPSGQEGPLALVNVIGHNAPRTNVARSDFEMTPEYRDALRNIYTLYASHISDEIGRLQEEEGQSVTWAMSEVPYILNTISHIGFADYEEGLLDALRNIPLFLLEQDGTRIPATATELAGLDYFWTIDGAFSQNMELLLREIPESISFTKIIRSLESSIIELPDGPMLCSKFSSGIAGRLISENWVISHLVGDAQRRRYEAKWVKKGGPVVWAPPSATNHMDELYRIFENIAERIRYDRYALRSNIGKGVLIPLAGVTCEGFDDGETAVAVGSDLYLLPGSSWLSVVKDLSLDDLESESNSIKLQALSLMIGLCSVPYKELERMIFPLLSGTVIEQIIDLERYSELVKDQRWKVFDTRFWQRKAAE
jgi:molecular chaperone HtpG